MTTSMTGYIVLTVICTIVFMSLGVAFAVAVRRAYKGLKRAYDQMCVIGAALGRIAPAIEGVWRELASLRSLLTPAAEAEGIPGQVPPYVPVATPRGPIPFPQVPGSLWAHIPKAEDAKVEDTPRELTEQTEEDLAEQLRLEEMRERGQDVDDEPKPGIVANAE